jgi:hypothetical protein
LPWTILLHHPLSSPLRLLHFLSSFAGEGQVRGGPSDHRWGRAWKIEREDWYIFWIFVIYSGSSLYHQHIQATILIGEYARSYIDYNFFLSLFSFVELPTEAFII